MALATLGLALAFAAVFLTGWALGAILAAVVAVVVAALVKGRGARGPAFWSVISSAIIAFCSGAYVWWVTGVQVDAADNFTQAPALANYDGVGLVILAISFAVLAASTIMILTGRAT